MVLRVSLLFVALGAAFAQRPLTHADYDSWRSIANAKLSDDGRYLVYGLFPQVGDGEIVMRETGSSREIRVPAGQRPEPPAPDFGSEDPPPPPPSINPRFSTDSAWLIATVFPNAADIAQAKKEKKKPADQPKNGLVVVNLATGAVTRAADVKSVQVPESNSRVIAFLKYSGELVLHSLADGQQVTFPDAVEYRLTDAGDRLVYANKKGLYVYTPADAKTATLLAAEGKYAKLVSDESQRRFAVIKDSQLYVWTAGLASATLASGTAAAASPLQFSLDGNQLFFGIPALEAAKPQGESEAVYDLWHYQDDFIQPMQKVRARRDRDRSYRAVYRIPDNKVLPLADATLPSVTISRPGDTAFGLDDRAYRRMVDHEGTPSSDLYLVDPGTGKRQLVQKQIAGTPTISPDGRFALHFHDKHWNAIDLRTGARSNLTSITGRAFHREDDDHPAQPPAYGVPIFLNDSKSVLLPDRHDIWHFALDGSLARNLTDGAGQNGNLQFRVLNLNPDPKKPGLDPTQPLLLRAVDLGTQESGFWRDAVDPQVRPQKLLMGPKNHAIPAKAKNGDRYVITASDFRTFPDLHLTDSSMKQWTRVTEANPALRELAWGSSEVIKYRNADGVELSAALFKPANYDPSKKYPVIVYIYEKLADTVFDFVNPAPSHRINASYYTSNGYVVLMPDIVYTIGYPGASALKCVLPAVQKLVETGIADPKRIGIQGHSWGGYQIAYMVTQTNLFRAAAPGALVANMISAYDGIRWGPGLPRQFQYERTQSRIGGTPWQYPMRFIENSPIFMADRVQTPILMLHNDADDAVPWYQGIEFFLALRRLGKEVYFFNYNGEPHGVRKRPNQKDYTVRMQQFFDYYLKDAPKPSWMERGRPYLEKETGPVPAAPTDHER